MLILFPKLELPCLLRWSLIHLLNYCQNPLPPVSQIEMSDFHITLPSQLYRSYSFSERIILFSHALNALSFPLWLSWSKHFNIIVSKTLPAAPVRTFYRTLIISFLTVMPLSLQVNQSLALKFASRRVAQLLDLCEVPLLLHPSEGAGSTTTQPNRFHNTNNAVCFTDC